MTLASGVEPAIERRHDNARHQATRRRFMNLQRWLASAGAAALLATAAPTMAQTTAPASPPAGAAPTRAQAAPPATDLSGLVEVNARQFDKAYVRPGTDLRTFSKFIVAAGPVRFAPDWLKNLNTNKIAVLQGTSEQAAKRIAAGYRSELGATFVNVFQHAGYELAEAPGPGVLAIAVALVDLHINAPETVINALPSRVYSNEAGNATVIIEVRDGATGEMLAIFNDHRIAGNRNGLSRGIGGLRNTTNTSNQFDFGSMYTLWAMSAVDELKKPPVAAR
jgi:hypothetical protein